MVQIFKIQALARFIPQFLVILSQVLVSMEIYSKCSCDLKEKLLVSDSSSVQITPPEVPLSKASLQRRSVRDTFTKPTLDQGYNRMSLSDGLRLPQNMHLQRQQHPTWCKISRDSHYSFFPLDSAASTLLLCTEKGASWRKSRRGIQIRAWLTAAWHSL